MSISARAEIITRRTYCRPLNDEGTEFETWEQVIERVVRHQKWLWERALTQNVLPGMPLHDITEDMSEWVSLTDEQEYELEELFELMYHRKALPSGRTLWLGGTDISKTREASQFNCSHLNIETIYDMVDAFWLLLQGCGVGATPKVGTLNGFRKPISNIDIINSKKKVGDPKGREWNEETFINGVWHLSIGDSAEAWAKAVGKILANKVKAHTLVLDFSEIRAEGQRLKGYGWISSGDGPFSRALPQIAEIMNRRSGNLLQKLDIVEIMNLLGTVLSSRRSAEIMLVEYGSAEWYEFSKFKERCYEDGFKHRQQSNNSLVFYNKPTKEELTGVFDMMIAAGGSEPGFYNGRTALQRAPWFAGTNPSLRKGTLVYTTEGIIPIEKLENKEFNTFTLEKEISLAKCWLSGKDKQLYKVTLEGGHSYYATAEHKWPISRKGHGVSRDSWSEFFKAPTTDILPGDCLPIIKRDSLFNGTKGSYEEGLFLGWLQGDGWITIRGDNSKAQIGLIVSEIEEEIIPSLLSVIRPYSKATFTKRNATYELNTQNDNLYKYILSLGYVNKENIPTSLFDSEYSEDFRKGFIDGIFSSDGSIETTSYGCTKRICLTSSRDTFIHQMAELLGFYGIKTSVTTGTTKLNNREYHRSDLRISDYSSIQHFMKLFYLTVEHKWDSLLELKTPKRTMLPDKIRVISVEKTELFEDVWDISVQSNSHTFQLGHCITGNCGEILLANKSFCNLSEIDVGKFAGDSAGLHRAATLISRANYRQTVVDLRDGILQEAWHKNNEFLRLCGVGVTGIAKRDDMTEYDWKNLRYSAVTAARNMAGELKMEYPKNVTTVKPSGTLSKIMDTTEGVHKAEGKYLFNWVNFSNHDPIVQKLKDANYRTMTNPADPTGTLACLPVSFEEVEFDKKEVTRADGTVEILEVNLESAISQLERYKKIQVHYCDQNVSNTIYYRPEEKDQIVDWLLENWDIYVGVSFLFKNDPTVSAKDLGFNYLPQEYVTKEAFEKYISEIKPVNWKGTDYEKEYEDDECATGACPIK